MRTDRAIARRLCLITKSSPARVHRIGFGEIKIAGLVRLQIEDKFMETFGGHDLVVEILVVISLAISIQIVIARNLIAARRINDVIDDSQTERFIHPRGETPPV